MNRIMTEKNETINDIDAIEFYKLLSQCIEQELKPTVDTIVLMKPTELSRNSKGFLIYSQINKRRRVALKRCKDYPEYVRREIAVAAAQKILGFPSYNIIKKDGIILRNQSTKKNCKILCGWENKTLLVIDHSDSNAMKTLRQLCKDEIDMLEFFYNYGKWAAFNCLFGVQDRHDKNFVISIIDQKLYSVDNEEGPFVNDKLIDIRFLITQTKKGVQRFLGGFDEPVYVEKFRSGFIGAWNKIASNLSSLDMFNKQEKELLRNSIAYDPEKVVKTLFY